MIEFFHQFIGIIEIGVSPQLEILSIDLPHILARLEALKIAL
jgi:hypothetical protein